MASTQLFTRKNGSRYYKIRVRDGRDGTTHCTVWNVPDTWSAKVIERELSKAAAAFENKVKSGQHKTLRERKEAAKQEAEEAAKIRTLKQYGESVFMPALTVTCAENTRDSYQSNLDNHIYPVLGKYKLPEITPAQLNAFLLKKQSTGLSPASCVKLYQILNQLFKKAYYEDVIDKNPMDKVNRPKAVKGEEAEQEALAYTAKEVKYILQCLEKDNAPLYWRAYIRLLAETGLRRGEALGLKWDDINDKTGEIHVKRTLCYTPKKGVFTNTPKSGKSRIVTVSPVVLDMFAKMKQEQQEANKAIMFRSTLSGFVFQQEGIDEPIHPQSPTRYFERFGKRHGIKDFHPHKMRHSYASIAITGGKDIASVSEVLGHSDKALTLRMYTHADEESKRKTSEAVWAAIKNA